MQPALTIKNLFKRYNQQAQDKNLEGLFARLTGNDNSDTVVGSFMNAFEND